MKNTEFVHFPPCPATPSFASTGHAMQSSEKIENNYKYCLDFFCVLKTDSINYFAALFIYKLTLPVISRLHPIDCLGGGVEGSNAWHR